MSSEGWRGSEIVFWFVSQVGRRGTKVVFWHVLLAGWWCVAIEIVLVGPVLQLHKSWRCARRCAICWLNCFRVLFLFHCRGLVSVVDDVIVGWLAGGLRGWNPWGSEPEIVSCWFVSPGMMWVEWRSPEASASGRLGSVASCE